MLTVQASRASLQQIEHHIHAAIQAALGYFQLQHADLRVEVQYESPEGGACANCTYEPDYLRAVIRVDLDYFQRYPERIWGTLGHEVAHLATKELMACRAHLPEEPALLGAVYTTAIEQATTRLERMFVRDCKEPDWGGA